MKKGKISESVLKRSVLKYIHTQRDEILKGADIGSDCAFFRCVCNEKELPLKNNVLAVSTQTISIPVRNAGSLAVYAAVNNLAASGAEAFAVTLAVTLPEEAPESQLQELMKQIENICKASGIQIAGGHTEVADSVKNPVITVTAVGKVIGQFPGQSFAERDSTKPDGKCGTISCSFKNSDIVITKWIGIEGTVILAKEKEKELLTRYPLPLITAAQGFEKYLPILPEAATARKSDVYMMHDVRNGGVFGALWELSKSMGVGLSIDLKKIPVKQETIEICEFFDLNPYELLSGGCLLIVTADGNELVKKLAKEGIASAVIGRTTDSNDKIILNEDETRFLEPAKPDEIFKVAFN